jgi:hypothetical protein
MTLNDDLHQLVDQLDEDAARDSEPERAEARAAVADAEADFAAGRADRA